MAENKEKVEETIKTAGLKPGVEVVNNFEQQSFTQTTAFKVGTLVLTHAAVMYLGYQLGKRAGWNESMSAGAPSTPTATETL